MSQVRCAYHDEPTGKHCGAFAARDQDYCSRHLILVEGFRPDSRAEEPEDEVAGSTLPDEEAAYFQSVAAETDPDGPEPYERLTAELPEPDETAEDPALLSARYARLLLMQEEKQRAARSRGVREPGRAPFKVIPRRVRADATLVLDPETGQPPASLKKGWLVRHVSVTDQFLRPTESRVADWEDYGGQVVRSASGKAISSRYGVVMQISPEQNAQRTADKSPTGAVSRDAARVQAEEMAEQANRHAGQRVASVFEMPEHGTRREWGRVNEE